MNNLTYNESELCRVSKTVSDRVELKVVYILECFFGLIALFPNLMALTLLWRVRVFHANLRLILANLTCNLLIFSAKEAVKAFQRLAEDVCTFPMLLRSCVWRDLFVIIPVHNALLTLVILSMERLYATIRYRTYDYASSTPYLGMFLLACAWAVTLGLNVPAYFASPPNVWVPICELALVGHQKGVAFIIVTMVTFEIMAAVVTFFVYAYNKYILGRMALNRARYDLSARFQVTQNEQLNKALMPSMVWHMTCYLPTYIFLSVLLILDVHLTFDTKAWLLHLTYLWRLLYALVDPILLITLNASLRNGFQKTAVGRLLVRMLRCCGKRNVAKTQDVAAKALNVMNAHFDFLQQSWAVYRAPTVDKI